MNLNAHHVRGITVHAMWTGFATPSQHTNRAPICRCIDGEFSVTDSMTQESANVAQSIVQEFLSTLLIMCPKPEPLLFGRSQNELDWHFGSLTTDDYPAMIVEIELYDASILKLSTRSNHAHLLPWTIEFNSVVESFHPGISIALAAMLPEGFLFHDRLASSEVEFSSDAKMRDYVRLLDEKSNSEQQVSSHEDAVANLNSFMNGEADKKTLGEAVAVDPEKRHYSANKLRRLSEDELKKLVADGYDLSTSDETGQTALMLAAFPPFKPEQFQKLVRVGADVDARRADGLTGLMLACAGHMQDGVRPWLTAGATVDLRGPRNCTALMLGAKCHEIVENLLKHGADAAAKDDVGDTALEYAMDDLSVMQAGSRLASIQLLADELASKDPEALRRSYASALETARKTRLDIEIQYKFGCQTMSDKIAKLKERRTSSEAHSSYLADLAEFIDLEITEIELADRIVETIGNLIIG